MVYIGQRIQQETISKAAEEAAPRDRVASESELQAVASKYNVSIDDIRRHRQQNIYFEEYGESRSYGGSSAYAPTEEQIRQAPGLRNIKGTKEYVERKIEEALPSTRAGRIAHLERKLGGDVSIMDGKVRSIREGAEIIVSPSSQVVARGTSRGTLSLNPQGAFAAFKRRLSPLEYIESGLTAEEIAGLKKKVPQSIKLPLEQSYKFMSESPSLQDKRYNQYRAIGSHENWIRDISGGIYESARDMYKSQDVHGFINTGIETLTYPVNIFKGTYKDIKEKPIYSNISNRIRLSPVMLVAGKGKESIESSFLKLPSSSTFKEYLGYSTLPTPITPFGFGGSKLASNIFSGTYETIRTRPIQTTMELGLGYVIGGAVGLINRIRLGAAATKIAGVGMSGIWAGSLALGTALEPKEARGALIGSEIPKAVAFIGGFGSGYNEFKSNIMPKLFTKKNLLYKGETLFGNFGNTIESRRFGNIKEYYANSYPIERSGIIFGQPEGRIKSITGSFLHDVSKNVIYEDRFINYEGLLFNRKFLVKQKTDLGKKTMESKLFELGGKKVNKLFEIKTLLPKQGEYLDVSGWERSQTKQIESLTPKRGIELFKEGEKIKAGKVLVPKKVIEVYTHRGEPTKNIRLSIDAKPMLRKLRVKQVKASSEIGLFDNAILKTDTTMFTDLRASQTSPEKYVLSYIVGTGDQLKKLPIMQQKRFRDLYYGPEKFESRRSKYDRNVMPTSLFAYLEKQHPEFIPALDIGKGIKRKYGVKFYPKKEVGLESQYVPPKITKRQFTDITQEFEIFVPDIEGQKVLSKMIGSSRKKTKLAQKKLNKEIEQKNYMRSFIKKLQERDQKANERMFKSAIEEAGMEKIAEQLKIKMKMKKRIGIDISQVTFDRAKLKRFADIMARSQSGRFKSRLPTIQPTARAARQGKKPIADLENIMKGKAKAEIRANSEIRSNLKNELKNKQQNKINQNLRNNLRGNIKTNQQLRSKLDLKLQTKFNTFPSKASPTSNIPPPFVYTPPPPPPPFIPNINKRFMQEIKKKGKSTIKLKYQPSLIAVAKRITGKKPDFMTGLRLRPVVF